MEFAGICLNCVLVASGKRQAKFFLRLSLPRRVGNSKFLGNLFFCFLGSLFCYSFVCLFVCFGNEEECVHENSAHVLNPHIKMATVWCNK